METLLLMDDDAEVSGIALERADSLLNLNRKEKEVRVQAEVTLMLDAMGYRVEMAESTPSGEGDLYLPQHKTVIETKRRGNAAPDRRNSATGETQQQQLARYVRDLAHDKRGLLASPDYRDASWKGILTDGLTYHLYRFDAQDGQPLPDDAAEVRDFEGAPPLDLCEWLRRRLGESPQLRPLPAGKHELAQIFASFMDGLRSVYQRVGARDTTKTKEDLWRQLNEGSGFDVGAPGDELFQSHTLLVTGAHAVIASLEGDARPGAEIVSDGFSSWPQNRDRDGVPTSELGRTWTNRLFDSVRDYDWRSRGHDVLRDMYEGVIPKRHRKAFGEYYTPDWLAAAVVEQVLDDDWCQRAIAAARESIQSGRQLEGVGVLDPACGSGTFLFHAARRILESQAMREAYLSPAEQAEVILKLVHGIDVHPVAVTIAKATLLRALPAGTSLSAEAANVYQADSLGIDRTGGIWRSEADDGGPLLATRSPGGTYIPMPIGLVDLPDMGSRIRRVVASAHADDELPADVARGMNDRDQGLLHQMHQALRQVCAREGNSVWAWWLNNYLAARSLRRRKVDRIVANPPWVVMKDIQVETRKRELEAMIESLGLSAGRHNAAKFDIAGLFVRRCRDLYLKGEDTAAGWVLNWAALKSNTWQRVRDDQQSNMAARWDLANVKAPPFAGAKSCVWLQRSGHDAEVKTDQLRNVGGERVAPGDGLADLQGKVAWVGMPRGFDQSPSAYSKSFRNGATLFPHCLVLVEKLGSSTKPGHAAVTFAQSRHAPWNDVPQQSGAVLEHRIARATFASHDLLAFRFADDGSQVVIAPAVPDGDGDTDDDEAFMRRLDRLYRANCGRGTGTPPTLRERLDYGGALSTQMDAPPSEGLTKVVYNNSGQILRAARQTGDVIAANSCWHASFETEQEAAYLTAVLNAPALQSAYQQSRTSDRDFASHPLRTVPVPAFDSSERLHNLIADLCTAAEAAAQRVLGSLDCNTGQIKASSAIRRELLERGVADRIDDAVRDLLPNHTVREYDAATPHPWR